MISNRFILAGNGSFLLIAAVVLTAGGIAGFEHLGWRSSHGAAAAKVKPPGGGNGVAQPSADRLVALESENAHLRQIIQYQAGKLEDLQGAAGSGAPGRGGSTFAGAPTAGSRGSPATPVPTDRARGQKVLEVVRPWATDANGQELDIPVQSPAVPLGLEKVGPVQAGGLDEASDLFKKEALPEIVKQMTSEAGSRFAEGELAVSPEDLVLDNAADVRVYFVGDSGAYHNSVGLNTPGAGGVAESRILFPDASSAGGDFALPSENEPMVAGDYVDLGRLGAGTPLDLFLVSNGAAGGTNVFSADSRQNPGGSSQMVVRGVVGDSMLLLGFEDSPGGGDRDFEDVVIAVDVGRENAAAFLRKNGNR